METTKIKKERVFSETKKAVYSRSWYNKNKEYVKKKLQEYRKKYPYKKTAQNKLENAIRRGDINKGSVCHKCGNTSFIEAHHEDYSKPLEVIWLCRFCHTKLHKSLKGLELTINNK